MIKPIITDKDLLSIKSRPIKENDVIGQIIDDLVDTAEAHRETKIGCAGLAANQIGHNYRIIVIWHNNAWLVMVNPTWKQRDDKMGSSHEGCLSRPGVNPKVKRYKRITCEWFDRNNFLLTVKFAHFTARVIQHECDHLDGIYINN